MPMGSFEDVYRQHVHAVYRFALSVSGKRETAEDLTSEAFLALYRRLEAIDQTQLPSWLITVVRNRARDMWRRQAVEQRYTAELPVRTAGRMPELECRILDDPALKPTHRLCLILRYVHGMTRAEIASRTGLSESQVKGHLQYSLSLLRKSFPTAKDERVAAGDTARLDGE